MEIGEILHEDTVKVGLESEEKESALAELVDLFIKAGKISNADKNEIIESLMERESLGSTGIGQSVGIPHAKTKKVKKIVAALGISKSGVEFEALDGEKVKIIFLLLAPEGVTGPHLKALAHISRILRDKLIRERLIQSKNKVDILKVLEKEDKKFSTIG